MSANYNVDVESVIPVHCTLPMEQIQLHYYLNKSLLHGYTFTYDENNTRVTEELVKTKF